MAAGRPTSYTKETADRICEAISTSNRGLHLICKNDEGLPHPTTIMRWLSEEGPEFDYFRKQYACARDLQADFIFEEVTEIADHTDEDHTPFTGGNVVQRDRLRVDARKWQASKLAPKKYGDKLDVTTDGQAIVPISGMVIQAKEKQYENQ